MAVLRLYFLLRNLCSCEDVNTTCVCNIGSLIACPQGFSWDPQHGCMWVGKNCTVHTDGDLFAVSAASVVIAKEASHGGT